MIDLRRITDFISRKQRRPMGLLPDWEIQRLAESDGMIYPFVDRKIRQECGYPTISYGLSSYGYDLRLSPKEFKIFRHIPGSIADPKDFNPNSLVDAELYPDGNSLGRYFIMPGHTYSLGFSHEKLRIPPDITVLFIGKSTYARLGVIANLTPGEAAWEGHLTLEFSNSSDSDSRIYANEGIVQALFFRGEPCRVPYGDGKYQNQGAGVVMARV